MKTLNYIKLGFRLLPISCFLLAIAGSSLAQRENYDDLLYAPSKEKKVQYQEPKKYVDSTVHVQTIQAKEKVVNAYSEDNSSTQQDGGNSYTTNNYNGSYTNYSDDDYYDYAYAARIKRFYGPYSGWSYYNDYYTNAYWYTYDPYYWGTSIYLSYNWWYPSSWYYGWGWGTYSYWGWGYPGSYWAGYNYGYWNGYWNGYYASNCYYNSYDGNSCYYGRPVYYGARTAGSRASYGSRNDYAKRGDISGRSSNDFMRSSSDRNRLSSRSTDGRTFGERYESSTLTRGSNTGSRNAISSERNNVDRSSSFDRNSTSGIGGGRAYEKPAANKPTFERRGGVDMRSSTTMNRPNDRTSSTTSMSSREVYRKPAQEQTRTYESTTPASNNRGSQNRSYSAPSREQQNNNRYTPATQSTPSRYNNTNRTENNNSRYSSPERTSTPSYSAPSRSSSPSYSAPSSSPARSSSPASTGGSSRGSSDGGSRSGGRR